MIKQLVLKSKYGNFDCMVNYTHYADGNKAITNDIEDVILDHIKK